jgi:hypothetical protein
MAETTLAPNAELFAALADLQAEYPKVAKGQTAQVKSDKGNYSYDYSDLASCSEVIMPLLGKHGLAFIARPTRNGEGDFVLAYSLVHKSGAREDGDYPLPSSGTAQSIGSAITYARRYSLCAITGIAPGGKDDDGAEATARGEMQTSRPRQQSRPAEPLPPPSEPDEKLIADWGAKIDGITSQEEADTADAELKIVFGNKRMDATTAQAIRKAIKAKAASLPAGPKPAPPAEDAETEKLIQRAVAAKDLAELGEVWVDIRAAQKITVVVGHAQDTMTLGQFVQARKAEMEAANGREMAGASK